MNGLYIPGLSMPRKTGIVSIVLSGDGSALLCEDGAYSEIKVIPVPDHGDLIGRDALIEDIANMVPWAITDPTANAFLDGLSAAYETIKAAPTIIPTSTAGKEGEGCR